MPQGTQLTLPLFDVEKVSVTSRVTDAQIKILQRFCGYRDVVPFVETYSPSRRKTEYYRLSWRDGKRIKHLHIRGGNVYSQLAIKRAEQIRQMCNRNLPLEEIIAAVKSF